MKDMMIGVDLAKTVFQVHGALQTGEVQFRKKLTRKRFVSFLANLEPCLVIFEACGGAHFWAREMEALGHEAKLIAHLSNGLTEPGAGGAGILRKEYGRAHDCGKDATGDKRRELRGAGQRHFSINSSV